MLYDGLLMTNGDPECTKIIRLIGMNNIPEFNIAIYSSDKTQPYAHNDEVNR